jgi:hypothetical protein
MSGMLCFICQSPGDNIASDCREVYLEDDGHKTVYVGPTCFKKVKKAGAGGLVSGKGHGPRVFFTFDQAAAYADQLTAEASATDQGPK